MLLSYLISNDNTIEVSIVKNFYNNDYPDLMDYYNSGVSSESSYFLTKYIYNTGNLNFHVNPLFQENNSKILSMGVVYKFNNHYVNLGKVHPYKYKKHSYTITNNSLPFYQIEFGNNEKILSSIFHLDYFITLGLLNDEKPYFFDIDYGEIRSDQYIRSPLIHSKNFNFSVFDSRKNEYNFGFSHAAMFGGEILMGESILKPRNDFKAFLDVLILRPNTYQNYDTVGEGNHVGSLDFTFKSYKDINFYIQKMFDDRSGFSFKNAMDGIYILELPKNNNLLNNIILESIISKNQSGKRHPPGIDSYYWHNIYTNGWRQDNFSIGNAFILPNNNRKTIYKLKLNLKNKVNISLYRINEFEYYGAKSEDDVALNINHDKIIDKKKGIGLNLSNEFQGFIINHFFNYEHSSNNDLFGYKIKVSRQVKL
tara:strand:- start:194 stop:1465 length:1272 start_codon:yes stop_codon:yes gene_type:complete